MNADEIGHCLARNLFRSDLVAVDRCLFTGNECDLLVVTPRLQIIDVEVKISRADLKVDRKKEKWFEPWNYQAHGWRKPRDTDDRPLQDWPQKVWKHYYAMPAWLWKPELKQFCAPTSGIIIVDYCHPNVRNYGSPASLATRSKLSPLSWHHQVVKRAKPNPKYEAISSEDLRKIAYLASCRMWSAYEKGYERAYEDAAKSVEACA